MRHELGDQFVSIGHGLAEWAGRGSVVATIFVKVQPFIGGASVNDVLNGILTTASIVYVFIKTANELKRRKQMRDEDKK